MTVEKVALTWLAASQYRAPTMIAVFVGHYLSCDGLFSDAAAFKGSPPLCIL